jgi:hypothetical protein
MSGLSCTCSCLSTGLLKAMRGIFLCWIPAHSISCVFLLKQHIHMGESDGPTYRLISRVSIPLLAPCYFNETDSGTVKIFYFFASTLFSLHIFFIYLPIPLVSLNILDNASSYALTFEVILRLSLQ